MLGVEALVSQVLLTLPASLVERLANGRQYVLEHGAITQIDLCADLHAGREGMLVFIALDRLVYQLHQCAITRWGLGSSGGIFLYRYAGMTPFTGPFPLREVRILGSAA